MRIKLQHNVFQLWIIVPPENERLAWTGSHWVPIDRDGVSVGDEKVMSFAAPADAVRYAESVGFEVEHG